MIVNSILLVMMTALALFQTACTPITPSLDRRLFAPKKDTQPSTSADNSISSTSTIAAAPSIKDPLRAKAKIVVSIRDAVEIDDDSGDDELLSNDTTELDFDSLELFKKDEQVEITIADPKSSQFIFDLALSAKDAKNFDAKDIAIELVPTESKDKWTLQIAPKQEDPKLAKKVVTFIHSMQWKKNPKKTESLTNSISNKSVSVI